MRMIFSRLWGMLGQHLGELGAMGELGMEVDDGLCRNWGWGCD